MRRSGVRPFTSTTASKTSLMEKYAIAKNCDYLTLTAATPELVPVFRKFGFTVETNDMGRQALAMEKKMKP